MKIQVKQVTTINKYDYLDRAFYCTHNNIEVEKPCCNGNNCGCWGTDKIYCPDCDNEDLSQYDADDYFLNSLIGA